MSQQEEKVYPRTREGMIQRMKDKMGKTQYKSETAELSKYNYVPQLPGDTDVAGFARGVDDLGQIILNNKKEVKFIRALVTEAGANYWVAQKNRKAKDGKKWSYAVADINGDGITEVIVRDGNGLIRYINGFGVGKGKHKVNYAFQDYLDSLGNPRQRTIDQATNKIQKGQMSMKNFMYDNLRQDADNPDGAMIPIGFLEKVKYKPKAPSACNLFMSYIMKNIYKNACDELGFSDEIRKKMSRIYGLIQANAYCYAKYVTEPALKECNREGIGTKEAKKKRDGKPTILTEKSLRIVKEIFASNDKQLTILDELVKMLREIKNTHLGTIHPVQEHKPYNPRYYAPTGPDTEKYTNRYNIRGTNQIQPQKEHDFYRKLRQGGLAALAEQADKEEQTNNDNAFSQPAIPGQGNLNSFFNLNNN